MAVADARHAVDFAEVVVLLLDATRGLEHQDLKIASLRARGRPRADDRDQQVGRRRGRRRGCSTASAARSTRGWRRSRACRCWRSRRGPARASTQLIAAAFEMREAWSKRVPTAALNRWFDDALEANPAAGAGRQADQAALHHPGQDPPAGLRAVRHAARPAAGELPALPGQRHPPRAGLRRGADPADACAAPKNPFAKD